MIELTEATAVTAVSQLTIRYHLEGLDHLPENPAVEEGAFHSIDTHELFVHLTAGRPDWQALAHVVRDEILPGAGPGTALAIKAALAPDDPADALADLQDYPPLRDEVLAEFDRLAHEPADDEQQPAAGEHPDGDFYDDQDDQHDVDVDHDDTYQDERHTDRELTDTANIVENPSDVIVSHDGDDHRHEHQPPDDDEPDHANAHRLRATGGTSTPRPTPSSNGATTRRHGTQSTGESDREASGKPSQPGGDHQLISYVTTSGSIPSADGARQQQLRDAAGEAGVDLVITQLEAELRGSGAEIEKMPEKNKGYDILVRDATGQPLRYIEVKSTQREWGLRGVGLTEPQFSLAREQRDRYWLYVVEHLYARRAQIWWICDPAGRVDYFHYDHGWQAAADGKRWVRGTAATVGPPN